jgi:organic hydroperoxide reductase OsmC/OhrA
MPRTACSTDDRAQPRQRARDAGALARWERPHERCPYSNATRGNIDIALSVDGTTLERRAA